MRLRPLPLLLAPLWLLLALCLLVSCTSTTNAGTTGGTGAATAAVVTVMPATTSIIIANATLPSFPTTGIATPIPTLPSALSPTELKYRILAQYPDFFFCDPDFYPVARGDEGDAARQRFPELQANLEEFQAILTHNGLSGLTTFTDEQQLLIYRQHKKLAALHFELAAGQYEFQLTSGGEGKQSFNIQGGIDGNGQITVRQKTPGFATCPICLAAHTRIDTPRGAVFVEDIKAGDPVWTLNSLRERVSAPVIKTARVPVSAGHILLHIMLEDGRELWASPGHPTADGRRLLDLQVGDLLDGGRVASSERVLYDGAATYDILPGGSTGSYWAEGILMGSTLGP